MGPKKEAYYKNGNPEDAGGPGKAHEAYESNSNPADPQKSGKEAYYNNCNPDDSGHEGFSEARGGESAGDEKREGGM